MKSLLTRFFTDHWQRKLASLILAIFLWLVVHHSMTSSHTFQNIPVSIINLPDGMTVEGMQDDARLNQRISLNIRGSRYALEDLQNGDLLILIDAKGKKGEWTEKISTRNLYCPNSSLDISQNISYISNYDFFVKLCPLISKKIPVLVAQPIGEAPKGYQYLDVWPYQLFLTVKGPEKVVQRMKSRGLKLTLNLNDIQKEDLDTITAETAGKDAVNFFVPDSWKQIYIPNISSQPVQIDDPRAKNLRIDFAKRKLYALNKPIPITIFFPSRHSDTLNPETYSIQPNVFITKINGLKMITEPLFVHGVSRQFLEIVKDMIEIVVIASPDWKKGKLTWNIQVNNRHELEDLYVTKIMTQTHASEEIDLMSPHIREDYLRNRFRSYMNKLRLYTPDEQKLNLQLSVDNQQLSITPQPRT